MRINKAEQALLKADQGQADCFSHDHSASMRYVLVLHGITVGMSTEYPASVISQSAGAIRVPTKEYQFLATSEPNVLPGRCGPLAILLVL